MTGEQFKQARKALNWTQAEVAEMLGLNAHTISDIEKRPLVKKIYAIGLAGLCEVLLKQVEKRDPYTAAYYEAALKKIFQVEEEVEVVNWMS